ncbi:hypothetical protein L2748_10500, partial [Shewanella sairae]
MSFTWFICFHKYLNGDCTYLVECLKVVAGISISKRYSSNERHGCRTGCLTGMLLETAERPWMAL